MAPQLPSSSTKNVESKGAVSDNIAFYDASCTCMQKQSMVGQAMYVAFLKASTSAAGGGELIPESPGFLSLGYGRAKHGLLTTQVPVSPVSPCLVFPRLILEILSCIGFGKCLKPAN